MSEPSQLFGCKARNSIAGPGGVSPQVVARGTKERRRRPKKDAEDQRRRRAQTKTQKTKDDAEDKERRRRPKKDAEDKERRRRPKKDAEDQRETQKRDVAIYPYHMRICIYAWSARVSAQSVRARLPAYVEKPPH